MLHPIIFLDIDGVLNDHTLDAESESSTLLPRCVKQFNRILIATDARVVLISAWRYMVLNGAMTLSGMDYLLRTHGVIKGRLIGTTRLDWDTEAKTERSRQVTAWRVMHDPNRNHKRLVIDNDDFGYLGEGHHFLQTDGKIGLTTNDAEDAIKTLAGV